MKFVPALVPAICRNGISGRLTSVPILLACRVPHLARFGMLRPIISRVPQGSKVASDRPECVKAMVRATVPRSALHRKAKVAGTSSDSGSNWIRQMIIVRGRMKKK